jgi:general transcription factor 3C polypeptide 1
MSTPSEDSRESDCRHACERHIYHPILPWINGDGSTNSTVYEGLTRRIIGYVMQYPGIVEVCIYFCQLYLLFMNWENFV